MKAIPLLEFDDKKAVIEPREQIPKLEHMPKKVVLTFFQDVVDRLYNDGKITKIYTLVSEMGRHPVYKFMNDDLFYNNIKTIGKILKKIVGKWSWWFDLLL